MTIIGGLLAILFLDPPWTWIIIAMLLAIDAVQIYFYFRTRNAKARSGPESLAGAEGVAVTECRPRGQVRIRGDIWKAYCPEGVDEGAKVKVLSIEGLEITVEPLAATSS